MKNRGFSPEEIFGQFDLSISYHYVEVEVEVKLRPTVSWPDCLGIRHPSGTRDQFFFLLEIFFRQLAGLFIL
jgi:hypothetical protein